MKITKDITIYTLAYAVPFAIVLKKQKIRKIFNTTVGEFSKSITRTIVFDGSSLRSLHVDADDCIADSVTMKITKDEEKKIVSDMKELHSHRS